MQADKSWLRAWKRGFMKPQVNLTPLRGYVRTFHNKELSKMLLR